MWVIQPLLWWSFCILRFAFCPVAAETFLWSQKKPRCTFDLINCTLCRFSHRRWVVFVASSSKRSRRNIFKPSAPQLEERSPSSEPTLHVLYSHHQQRMYPKAKSQSNKISFLSQAAYYPTSLSANHFAPFAICCLCQVPHPSAKRDTTKE